MAEWSSNPAIPDLRAPQGFRPAPAIPFQRLRSLSSHPPGALRSKCVAASLPQSRRHPVFEPAANYPQNQRDEIGLPRAAPCYFASVRSSAISLQGPPPAVALTPTPARDFLRSAAIQHQTPRGLLQREMSLTPQPK